MGAKTSTVAVTLTLPTVVGTAQDIPGKDLTFEYAAFPDMLQQVYSGIGVVNPGSTTKTMAKRKARHDSKFTDEPLQGRKL